MGKRELLLIVVFVMLGAGVYQLTAPAAPAGAPGFSLGRLVQHVKSNFGGPRERRMVTRTTTLMPTAGIDTLDLAGLRATVTIAGTDRPDIDVRAEVTLVGMDQGDLQAQEAQLKLNLDAAGTTAVLGVAHASAGRRPRMLVHVEVPSRFKVHLGGSGSAEIKDVAGLSLDDYEGQLRTDSLAGPVTGEIGPGRADFGPGAILELRTRRGELRAERPASVTLDSERTTLDFVDAAGPITLKEEFCRMEVRGTGGPVHVTGEGGVITLRDVRHPLTIDGDRLTVDAELAIPVATVITIENDDVELTLPRDGGVQLEASSDQGALHLPPGLTATRDGTRESITSALAGGGPAVTVTVTRGGLRVRTR